MRIQIDREMKIELLSALKNGYLDTENIEALHKVVSGREPARVLTKEEAMELIKEMERNY